MERIGQVVQAMATNRYNGPMLIKDKDHAKYLCYYAQRREGGNYIFTDLPKEGEKVYTHKDEIGMLWRYEGTRPISKLADVSLAEAIQKYYGDIRITLGEPTTIGELKKMIESYPDEMSFGFRNQPMQELIYIEHCDGDFKGVCFQEKKLENG